MRPSIARPGSIPGGSDLVPSTPAASSWKRQENGNRRTPPVGISERAPMEAAAQVAIFAGIVGAPGLKASVADDLGRFAPPVDHRLFLSARSRGGEDGGR